MPRVKRYIDTDVLTEARARLHHIWDLHDNLVVAFSGGKDSLATLHLTWEVAQERGLDHVNVVFRDEELIPDPVIDFVQHYRTLPWVRMDYLAVPLASTKYILGRVFDYVQWDPAREWIRPKPEFALREADLGMKPGQVADQYTMDGIVANRHKGKVAIVNGIRSSESIMRFRAAVNKLNDNYINLSSHPKATLCKPIFDWEENDVFRYFYDREIAYCALYDAQLWAGQNLRVSSPLHAESAKRFDKLRAVSPTFYDQLVELFPEMLVQERYYGELDHATVKERYGQSFDGVRDWIKLNLEDDAQRKALKRLAAVQIRARHSPDAYPPAYVLNAMMSGAFKREILPLRTKKAVKST